MKKLLVATWNPWKIEMFQNLLKDIDNIKIYYLSDFAVVDSPIEDGQTVWENAYIKAKYYYEKFWIPTLADDSWFEIPALWWMPWVMARRWWGQLPDSVSDQDWLDYYLLQVKDIPWEMFEWSFPFSRCLYLWVDNVFYQNENINFFLTKSPRSWYKTGSPTSSVRVFPDWRHELDTPYDDEIWRENLYKDWLIKLLENL